MTQQVFQVLVDDRQAGGGMRYGSAVLIDGERALTSCHVVGFAADIYVVMGLEPQRADLLAADRHHDLCLLRLPAGAQRTAPVCRPSAQVALGEQSYAIGFASGRLGFSRGPIQARFAFDDGFVLRTAAGFQPGASGGGLFDQGGRLLGVLTTIRRSGLKPAYLVVPCEWTQALVAQVGHGHGHGGASPREPFWQMAEAEVASAPWFIVALRLEGEERWTELEALAQRQLAASPGDEAAGLLLDQARQRQGLPARVSQAEPAVVLQEASDSQCELNGGRLVSLNRRATTADARALRVWVERWHLGMKTADRTRHDLTMRDSAVALGCSRTIDGVQHWEIVDVGPASP